MIHVEHPGLIIGTKHIRTMMKISVGLLYKLIEQHQFPAFRLPDGRWAVWPDCITQWAFSRHEDSRRYPSPNMVGTKSKSKLLMKSDERAA